MNMRERGPCKTEAVIYSMAGGNHVGKCGKLVIVVSVQTAPAHAFDGPYER